MIQPAVKDPTGFTPEGDVPVSAEETYFRASANGTNRLIAWDVIQELPATGSFSVRRHVVATDYGSLTPSRPGADAEHVGGADRPVRLAGITPSSHHADVTPACVGWGAPRRM